MPHIYDPKTLIGTPGLTRIGKRLLKGMLPFGIGLLADFIPFGWLPNRYYDMTGFRLLCRSGNFPITAVKRSAANPNVPCPIALQVPDGAGPLGVNVAWVGYGPLNLSGTRMTVTEQWLRTVPNHQLPGAWIPSYPPDLRLDYRPIAPPAEIPFPYPALDPFILPPQVPQPIPRPIPWGLIPHRRLNPDRSPHEQPNPGRGRNPRGRPGQGGGVRRPGEAPEGDIDYDPLKVRRRKPKHKPKYEPVKETVIEAGPSGKPKATTKPGLHARRPPGPREKERKFNAAVPPGFLSGLLEVITESADLLDAFFKSLDPATRRAFNWKNTTVLDKLAYVLENLDKVDVGHLVANITAMLLEDAGVGKLGKMAGPINRNLHKHFGVSLTGRLPKGYNIPMVPF